MQILLNIDFDLADVIKEDTMQPQKVEIVITKPTCVFLAFLASQLPETHLPDLKLLQTNTTAYIIPKKGSSEACIDEIEKHFSTMFRHEIRRWLGPAAINEIENNFLDFLCCFECNFHSHIILIEPELANDLQVVKVKPRAMLLEWMKSVVADDRGLSTIVNGLEISQLRENASLIIKRLNPLSAINSFLSIYYLPIFEAVMSRMSTQSSQWPAVSTFNDFKTYFEIELHTQLINLSQ